MPAGTGRKRSGQRVLTVGTDCALGKKYTALALTQALQAQGAKATFRATGQTGIMIAGAGVAIDAVIADFIAGAAETLSPDNAPDHWDVIEGQGALFHPAYAGVTLGLLHGSQPDALVLCHDPSRTTIEDYPHMPVAGPAGRDRPLRRGGAPDESGSALRGRGDQFFDARRSAMAHYRPRLSRRLKQPVWIRCAAAWMPSPRRCSGMIRCQLASSTGRWPSRSRSRAR